MPTFETEFLTPAYTLATLAHLLAAALVWLGPRRPQRAWLQERQPALRRLPAWALIVSALWCAAQAIDPWVHARTPLAIARGLDLLRYGLWLVFLIALLRPAATWRRPASIGAIGSAAAAAWLLSAALSALQLAGPTAGPRINALAGVAALGVAVLGALLVEQLFRNLPEDSRWNAKPLCLGLGVMFVFDVYMFAEAALFGRLDRDAEAVRGVVHMLALPLVVVAMTRRGNWVRRLQLSHTAAFYSATLVLAGGYLLFMAAVGYYVRAFGGQWGRAFQLGLVFAALLLLLSLLVSKSLRARLRVLIQKSFFSYRYDYRQEWLHFTSMLSSSTQVPEVELRIVRGLANLVDVPAGALWARDAHDGRYRQKARWNGAEITADEPSSSPLTQFLLDKDWVVDVEEYRASPKTYDQLPLPEWLLSDGAIWLIVPLNGADELLGFVTLSRPRTSIALDWEVRDLLKTAARQAAGHLAQLQAMEALIEARKFEAFNRMSAFVVHDLKNIVTQLALMLKNAQRLHDNAEFQQDMLLTVESSVEKMRRLMLQLREGVAPPGGASGVDLQALLRRISDGVSSRGRELDLRVGERLLTRGQEERLERVIGHMVQNALDATALGGRVWVELGRSGGQVSLLVGDTGVGMTEEFVRDRLFRPFTTTKVTGMGIGMFESAQYIRELGGTIDVVSVPGEGTQLTVTLPLFEPGR